MKTHFEWNINKLSKIQVTLALLIGNFQEFGPWKPRNLSSRYSVPKLQSCNAITDFKVMKVLDRLFFLDYF